MNLTIDLNTLVTMVVGGLVTYGLHGIRSINKQLRELNGDVKQLKTWKVEHEKLAEERSSNIKAIIRRLEENK